MILLIDNYDSFAYNLYQLIGSINSDIKVIRNDQLSIEEIEKLSPKQIVLSPGPGRPSNAGICINVVKHFSQRVPILGVCLGHQAICEAYGGTISYSKTLMHGKQSNITIDTSCSLFANLPKKIKGARYHSLSLVGNTLPTELIVTAKSDDNEIMAVSHKRYKTYGLQFHPESILTPEGKIIITNFLKGKV